MFINLVLVSVLAYLTGNFATAYLVSKAAAKIDIRNFGSGNAGSTNVLRVLGAKPAAITFVGDALKGAIAVLIGGYIAGSYGQALAGLFVVIGHNWPIVLKFKGGKGIATTIGLMLPIDPIMVLVIVAAGVTLIAFTKYVSLGSIFGMVAFPAAMIITQKPYEYMAMSIILSVMAVYRHRNNISKLIKGTESKIGQKIRTQ